jgi:uncharacterized pyridoxal phosphate-containing UPF0001 family protein
VAVSKTKPAAMVQEALDAGQRTLRGKLYPGSPGQGGGPAESKAVWHFIGHLQRNKAKYAVRLFDLIHTVDSVKLAREIDKQAAKIGKTQPVLVQVNIGGEASKSGTAPDECRPWWKRSPPAASLDPGSDDHAPLVQRTGTGAALFRRLAPPAEAIQQRASPGVTMASCPWA